MKDRRAEEWESTGVSIGREVDIDRIAQDAVLHSGCRIRGADTSIGPGCEIGAEAPASLENCQLSRNVELKGGFYSGATFLEGANMGSGAHVRPGTILEEEANGAHTVGLKQTVLLPFVTLGSLINFCDILMAGGTSRRNHSEVGSSYVHFNFTPHQDKATASLIGDVVEGVFLDKDPVFLGGQGGLVGPARITYGSVVAAGGVCRKDVLEQNHLHIPSRPEETTRPYNTGTYQDITRIVMNNLHYIGNLLALKNWYTYVRKPFLNRDRFDKACLKGGLKNIDLILNERIQRLGGLAHNMEYSIEHLKGTPDNVLASQRKLQAAWDAIEFELTQSGWSGDPSSRDTFLNALDCMPTGGTYITSIQSLEPEARETGRRWLASIVNEVTNLWPAQTD